MLDKRLIAPIIITLIIVLYYIAFGLFCLTVDTIPVLVKILGGIIPLLFAGVAVYVLIERIREIKNGEEDDFSQY